MHVACHYGQLGQVEILLAYGADVCLRDCRGQTPVDVSVAVSFIIPFTRSIFFSI